VDGVAVATAFAPMPGFLACPKPARGLETAALGTNNPPVLAGGADGRDRDEPPCVSSESCRVLLLNRIGSVRSTNLPASCKMVSNGRCQTVVKTDSSTLKLHYSLILILENFDTLDECMFLEDLL